MKKIFVQMLVLGLVISAAADGLRISEICPRPDALDPNGMESGWIELYNDSDASVNLADYEIVRVNRGKELKQAGKPLASRTVGPREYTVVYTSEAYDNAGTGVTTVYDNDVMVYPNKVSPKKFPMVVLYRGSQVVDKFVVPVDIPNNQSIAAAGGCFANYAGAVSTGAMATDASVRIANASAVTRVILPTITKGAANDRTGETAYGPNAGPLYGIKHSLSDWEPHAPAKSGENYQVRLAINPFSAAEGDAVVSVKLLYRSDFGKISSVDMTKDGEPDAFAGQYWTAAIPAKDLPAAGHLVRWAAQVTDASGNGWRTPSFRNPEDGYEWYGTIVEPTAALTSATLQTWHMFADSTSTARMNIQHDDAWFLPYGARCGIYDSQTSNFYDNVRIDLRGNTTAKMSKKSHGLKFSKVHPMTCVNPFDGEKIVVRKTSIIAEQADMSRVRSSLSMYLRRLAGQDVPFGYPLRVNLNGAFFQLDHHTNRLSDELLTDYYGYDENGYAIKNIGAAGGGLNASGGMSVILPDNAALESTAKSFYTSFQDSIQDVAYYTYKSTGLDATKSNKVNRAVVKQFNLPAWINFLALSRFTQECDDGWSNLSVYYDRLGNGTWSPIAYDLHQSLGVYFADDKYTDPLRTGLWADDDLYGKCHPYYGGMHVVTAHYSNLSSYGNRAYECIYQNAKYRRLHVRRLRTLMDKILMAPGTSQQDTPFWRDYVVPMVAAMQADDAIDREKWGVPTTASIYVWLNSLTFAEGVQDLWDNYFVKRRNHFFNTHSITNTAFEGGYAWDKNAQIPLAQSPIAMLKDGFSVETVEGGAVIRNMNAETVDMSGWTLSGAVSYTFPAGSVIDQAFGSQPGEIFVVTDRTNYIARLEASGTALTDQIILGNAKAGKGELYALKDADGAEVIADPSAPTYEIYTGVYTDPVTIDAEGDYVLSNATFNAGLVLGGGTYVLRNFKGTTNTASSVTAAGSVVFKQAGVFRLQGAGTDPLMTVKDLFVSNGTFKVDYACGTPKAMAVKVTGGFAVESEGTVDVTVGGTQNYGIYVANKNQFCRIGEGGKFKATVNGVKCAALYGNKGSVDADVENDSKVRATLAGNEARLFNFAGKIKLKGGDVEVTGAETSLSNKVFKSDKSISVKKGARITVEVPGAGSEAFSCADTFRMEGGHVEVVSADDCVGAETNVVVTGGKFYGRSLQNDVFDTNAGDITIDGGLVLAYTTAQEPTDNPSKTVGSFGFDVNGYQVNVNGGTVVAIGGDNLKGDHMPALAGSQNLFVDEEAAASKYSGKYLSLQVDGTNTTVGLPAIDATKCTVLFTVPGMPMGAQPQILNAAPETGSIDFHEVYVTEPEPILPFELGETAARPQTDYNGSVVTVRFTGDLPDGVTPAAKVTLDGTDYAGTVDVENGEVTFELPASVVTAGNTYAGVVTVTVGGEAYTKDVTLAQGTFRVHENTGWIRESAATFASTGSWSGDKAAVASGTIGVSNATFTAATVAPTASLVTIESTFDFRAASKKPLDASKRAGLCVVRVGSADRYAYVTAAGVVTNTTVAAKTTASVAVKVTLDTAANTVSYVVDGVEIGSGAMTAKSAGVSKVGYVGETSVAALTGAYRTEGLDANVAQAGGVEYATVAEALAAGQGQVQLLWDTAWDPSAAGDYTFDKNGFNLVIGGPLAYSVKDNGNGTVTVTVTGGDETAETPAPTSVTMSGNAVKVGVENVKPNLWYALEKTTDLTKPFVVDTTTWTKGSSLLAGEKELVIALGGTEPQAFYRVVVSTTAP